MKRWIAKHIGKFWMLGIFGFLYLPIAYLVVFSFNSTRQDAKFTGFSLRWYQALMNDSRILEGFVLSLKVAFYRPPSRPSWALWRPLFWCATKNSWAAACSQAW